MCSKENTIYFSWQLFIIECSLVNGLLWCNCFFLKILTCHSYVGVHWKTPCIGWFFCFILFWKIFIIKSMSCPPYMFMHLPTSNPYIIKPFIFNPTCLYIYLTISFTYYQLTIKYCVTCKYCVHIPIVVTFYFCQ